MFYFTCNHGLRPTPLNNVVLRASVSRGVPVYYYKITITSYYYKLSTSLRTAADFAVVIVAVVVVTLAEVAAVSELRVLLTDRIADASAALAATVTVAHCARVIPETQLSAGVAFPRRVWATL